MRRLFFALWPDEPLRSKLVKAAPEWTGTGARPVHRDDLHMTLQFLGRVPENHLKALHDAVAELRAQAFSLDLTRLGHWSRPGVAWYAPVATPAGLQNLVQGLGARLSRIGYPPESRPFRPHVTLARNVEELPIDVSTQVAINWQPSAFELVESLPHQPPPHYRVLGTWPLAPAN